MIFTRLAAENFRLFPAFAFEPGPGINLILGANAAGKTTLLEALYLLGRGRSFRGAATDLAGAAGARWRVVGNITAGAGGGHSVGVAWSPEGMAVRLDQQDAGLQDLVQHVAVQVLEPDSHRLLEEGPVYRRRYLDWGVFHVEHRFFPAWRRFQRALKQRNQALHDGAADAEVCAWHQELAASGEEVQDCRLAHVERLRAPLGEAITALLGPMDWSLELSRGWPAAQSLSESLAAHLPQDRRQGRTIAGPHRAELKLKLSGRTAKHQASRGQQKLLIAALLMAQAQVVRQATGRAPVLLLDDFPAELGTPFQQALLAALAGYPGQSFLTAIEPTEALRAAVAPGPGNGPGIAVFHVEHGAVSRASRV
jgi:DNA replication and repair protein RecF